MKGAQNSHDFFSISRWKVTILPLRFHSPIHCPFRWPRFRDRHGQVPKGDETQGLLAKNDVTWNPKYSYIRYWILLDGIRWRRSFPKGFISCVLALLLGFADISWKRRGGNERGCPTMWMLHSLFVYYIAYICIVRHLHFWEIWTTIATVNVNDDDWQRLTFQGNIIGFLSLFALILVVMICLCLMSPSKIRPGRTSKVGWGDSRNCSWQCVGALRRRGKNRDMWQADTKDDCDIDWHANQWIGLILVNCFP